MPAIIFDNWSGGQDLRRSLSMSAVNVLYLCSNCYVTTGRAIRKRPCATKIALLEPGTVGLVAGGGKLNTFYGDGTAITHADTRFRANRTPHITTGVAPTSVNYVTLFNTFLYASVSYADATTRHHYIDDPGSWVALTVYGANTFRRPTTANGFRYEVTAGGGGASGAGEPAWPVTIGATVADGALTWTCRTYAVTDTNCPHTKPVKKIGQKIYAASAGSNGAGTLPPGANVRFCAVSAPRDWTTASNAGFLASGISAAGSDEVTSLADFRGDLGVFYSDSAQVWLVDPDPANNELKSNSPNTGTVHMKSPEGFANDLVFLAKAGFRSMSLAAITDTLSENDIGSPIDALRDEIKDSDNLFAVVYPRLGQLWVFDGAKVYVLSYSKSAKITAWSTYTLPWVVDAATVMANEIYLRSGNTVYRMDATASNDDGVVPLCEVDMFFQDNKAPGILKQFTGYDAVVTGTAQVAYRYDPRHLDRVTDFIDVSGDTRPDAMAPMEICCTSLAPRFRHQRDEAFQLDFFQAYYEVLGPV